VVVKDLFHQKNLKLEEIGRSRFVLLHRGKSTCDFAASVCAQLLSVVVWAHRAGTIPFSLGRRSRTLGAFGRWSWPPLLPCRRRLWVGHADSPANRRTAWEGCEPGVGMDRRYWPPSSRLWDLFGFIFWAECRNWKILGHKSKSQTANRCEFSSGRETFTEA
jgi:hypothetical protein